MKSRLAPRLAADPLVSWTRPIIMGFGGASRSATACFGVSDTASGRGAEGDRRLHTIRKSGSGAAKATSFPFENPGVSTPD